MATAKIKKRKTMRFNLNQKEVTFLVSVLNQYPHRSEGTENEDINLSVKLCKCFTDAATE
jgi:hypothetical protein